MGKMFNIKNSVSWCRMETTATSRTGDVLALDNIRSAHNVGSIFRTADAAGMAHIYLIGTTPAPIDRFGRPQSDIAKTALGAEHSVSWTAYETVEEFITAMQEAGREIVALEQDARGVDYRELPPASTQSRVFVVGNEVEGVSKKILDGTTTIVYIPMHGEKESLNVSVATGVLLFSLLRNH